MRKKVLRVKKKKPFFKRAIFWNFILFSLAFYFVFYLTYLSEIFAVKNIKIFGLEKIEKEYFEKFLSDKIEGKNILFINSQRLKDELFESFPQVYFVEIKREFPSTLIFKVSERKEIAVFCQEKDCYLIDKEGIIFEKKENEEGNLLKIQNEKLDKELKLGQKVIEKEQLNKILEIVKKFDIEIESVILISENNLHFKTRQHWKIFIDPQKDIDWQLTKLKVALENAIPKEKINDLEYIDLRFGNFAFPKYKK